MYHRHAHITCYTASQAACQEIRRSPFQRRGGTTIHLILPRKETHLTPVTTTKRDHTTVTAIRSTPGSLRSPTITRSAQPESSVLLDRSYRDIHTSTDWMGCSGSEPASVLSDSPTVSLRISIRSAAIKEYPSCPDVMYKGGTSARQDRQ
jgi:hypothetical protein